MPNQGNIDNLEIPFDDPDLINDLKVGDLFY